MMNNRLQPRGGAAKAERLGPKNQVLSLDTTAYCTLAKIVNFLFFVWWITMLSHHCEMVITQLWLMCLQVLSLNKDVISICFLSYDEQTNKSSAFLLNVIHWLSFFNSRDWLNDHIFQQTRYKNQSNFKQMLLTNMGTNVTFSLKCVCFFIFTLWYVNLNEVTHIMYTNIHVKSHLAIVLFWKNIN